MPGTNALAYCEKSKLSAVKSFITLAPGEMISIENFPFLQVAIAGKRTNM
jgi:hypothetical protein